MLGQRHAAFAQHLRAVDRRMHQDVLADAERVDLLPGDGLALGQRVAVADDVLVRRADLVIDVVADQKIDGLLFGALRAQRGEHARIGVRVDPVVRIDDLEIHARRVGKAGHDRVAVSAVFLVDRADNTGIAALVVVCDFGGAVLRAVVDNQDLDLVAAGQQALYGLVKIRLGVVAGDSNR